MLIHMILGLNGEASLAALRANIEREYPDNHRALRDGNGWLVADQELAQVVSDKLGISRGGEQDIAAIVVTVSDYFGRGETAMWQWIKNQWEAEPPALVAKANSEGEHEPSEERESAEAA